ncbi:hypothetical protein REPUB_Repub03eG0227100 [Reevesia pubescens]
MVFHGPNVRKIGTVIGDAIGDILEIATSDSPLGWEKYLRVRVMIHVTKPLSRGTWIIIGNDKQVMVLFKYECIHDFYFICTRLDHHEFECHVAVQKKSVGGIIKREYGTLLIVDNKFGSPWIMHDTPANQAALHGAGLSNHEIGSRVLHGTPSIDDVRGKTMIIAMDGVRMKVSEWFQLPTTT